MVSWRCGDPTDLGAKKEVRALSASYSGCQLTGTEGNKKVAFDFKSGF